MFNRLTLLASFSILMTLPKTSLAKFTSFEDLVRFAEYSSGEEIFSNGLGFTVVSPHPGGAPVQVGFGFTGMNSLGFSGAGLDFQLASGTNHISFVYYVADFADIVVNGVAATTPGRLLDLDGMTLGGVNIDIEPFNTRPPAFAAMMTLDGPISSFIIRGQEAGIDDVSIIPEPAAMAMGLPALTTLGLAAARKRRASKPGKLAA